ncbi:hypothetical protein ACFL04_00185 [Patescibacteria group bacterium]
MLNKLLNGRDADLKAKRPVEGQGRTTLTFPDGLSDYFGNFHIVHWTQVSRFANIVAVEKEDGSNVVLKCLLPDEIGPLAEDDRRAKAEEFNRLVSQYHVILKSFGVKLPLPYRMVVTDAGWPIHEAPYRGENYEELVRQDIGLVPQLLECIVCCIIQVLHQPEPYRVGIDLRLSNFAGYPEDETCYVDSFPPLYLEGDTYHVFIPQPDSEEEIMDAVFRKFNPLGSIRRLRFDLLAFDPALEDILMELLESVLTPSLFSQVDRYFAGLNDRQIKETTPLDEVIRVIRQTDPNDIDALREIGARRVPQCEDRRKIMQRIFYCTRYPDPLGRRIATDPLMRHDRLIEIISAD